jgi:hypothetical protein
MIKSWQTSGWFEVEVLSKNGAQLVHSMRVGDGKLLLFIEASLACFYWALLLGINSYPIIMHVMRAAHAALEWILGEEFDVKPFTCVLKPILIDRVCGQGSWTQPKNLRGFSRASAGPWQLRRSVVGSEQMVSNDPVQFRCTVIFLQ